MKKVLKKDLLSDFLQGDYTSQEIKDISFQSAVFLASSVMATGVSIEIDLSKYGYENITAIFKKENGSVFWYKTIKGNEDYLEVIEKPMICIYEIIKKMLESDETSVDCMLIVTESAMMEEFDYSLQDPDLGVIPEKKEEEETEEKSTVADAIKSLFDQTFADTDFDLEAENVDKDTVLKADDHVVEIEMTETINGKTEVNVEKSTINTDFTVNGLIEDTKKFEKSIAALSFLTGEDISVKGKVLRVINSKNGKTVYQA